MILIGTEDGIYRWFEGASWPVFHSLQGRRVVGEELFLGWSVAGCNIHFCYVENRYWLIAGSQAWSQHLTVLPGNPDLRVDFQLRSVGVVLAVAERHQPLLGQHRRVGVGGGRVVTDFPENHPRHERTAGRR